MSNDECWFNYLHERTIDDTHFVLMCDTRNQQWVSEAWVRTTGGLRHQVMRWHERPRMTEIRAECIGTGIFTKRPYVLGQACDGSIGAPVMALYADFCRARELDPVKLLQLAYDDELDCTLESFAVTRSLADWQGTTFPKRWDSRAIAGLLTSLHAINYHQLTELVEKHAHSRHSRTARTSHKETA